MTATNVRFAQFNASLNRNALGQLVNDLSNPAIADTRGFGVNGDQALRLQQARTVAEIVQRVNPDVLLINEFDFDPAAVDLLRTNFLQVGQNGAAPVTYNFTFIAPSNTGVASGFDLDNNGTAVTTLTNGIGNAGYGNDAFGFGNFPGQFGMLLLSKYPIVNTADIKPRTFQNFLWKDMPNNLLTNDPTVDNPATAVNENLKGFYSPEEINVLRLSSKNHWDIPINVNGEIVHLLLSHPTPPVFDGPEDRNGKRNFDEIRFWVDYTNPDPEVGAYIYDDTNTFGGIGPNASFVIMGDQNADPFDGNSFNFAARQFLTAPQINTSTVPTSRGGVQQAQLQGGANVTQRGNPAFDTADFADTTPGNLRADYVLPSSDLAVTDSRVFWPENSSPLFPLVGTFNANLPGGYPSSDHRLIWADVTVGDRSVRPSVRRVELLGQATFPTGTPVLDGTSVGGLSGITYDAANNRYYALADARSGANDGPARFYTLAIDLSSGRLSQSGVSFTGVTRLRDGNGALFAANALDPEGIALLGTNLFISSEGQVPGAIAQAQAPFVNRFALSNGQQNQVLPVPTKFTPVINDANNNGTLDAGEQTGGIRNNLAFESLTLTPNQRVLYTATENALVQDGGAASTTATSRSRILKYNLTTGQPEQEYLYITDPVVLAPNPSNGFATNGLVELLALDDRGTLLALERSFSVGVPGTGNTIKLYEIKVDKATDISGIASLSALTTAELAAVVPAQKRLLVNFDNLGLTTGLDNVEGMTLGPKLPDGRRSLILVSDNNFSATQFTQVLALALDITSEETPSALPTVETVRLIDTDPAPTGALQGDGDDPAIYNNPTRPLVITAVKDGGLVVYDLAGAVVQTITPNDVIPGAGFGDVRYNNVDILRGFALGGATVDLAIASDRENDTLGIFRIIATGTPPLTNVASPTLRAKNFSIFGLDDGDNTAYGLATYRAANGESYVFVTQRENPRIDQLRLIADPANPGTVAIDPNFRRTLIAPAFGSSQFEGIVVDRDTGAIYAGQEDVGIWKYAFSDIATGTTTATGAVSGFLIHAVGPNSPSLRQADVEGLTIYYGPNGTGYLLASSQGENNFAVFNRQGANEYLGSFVVGEHGGIDSVESSDGADVTSEAIGGFTQGLLVVHDGNETPGFTINDGGEIENAATNFKYVPWQNVAGTFAPPSTLPNGVASGDTTSNSTVLWTRSTAPGTVRFEYSTSPTFGAIAGTQTATVANSAEGINTPVKVNISGLTPNTTYYYRVTDAANTTRTGQFKTAAPVSTPNGLRFGITGDWQQASPFPSLANTDTRNLEFFLKLGDTIYADIATPADPSGQSRTLAEFRAKHAEITTPRFGVNTVADLQATTSILSTIDDHEIVDNFAGGAAPGLSPDAPDIGSSPIPVFTPSTAQFVNDTPVYEAALQAFQEYAPLRDEFYGETGDARTANERRLYRYNTYGNDASMIVLDSRSFRDAQIAPASLANPTAFLAGAFAPNRTLLGRQQVEDLKRDLLDAQAKGITWKFVNIPEPIQNFGVVNAEDRFEGYAAERTEILKFIDDNKINNVVFLAGDFHGTIVNNLTYQNAPGTAQIATNAFEIVTGPAAFANGLFGPTVANLSAAAGFITPEQLAFYNSLPIASDTDSTPNDKDDFVKQLLVAQTTPLGYDPVGLNSNLPQAEGRINATLLQGDYVAAHTFGWTEFNVDPVSQQLRVTTYGINSYTDGEIVASPGAVGDRTPRIVSEFTVTPTTLPNNPSPTLTNANNIFRVGGAPGGATALQFTLTRREGELLSEVGAFLVDDATGRIGTLTPGQAGYTKAALERSRSLFSGLADNFLTNPTRQLTFNTGAQIQFYLVRNSTTDAVLAGRTAESAVVFSRGNTTNLQVGNTAANTFTLNWEDGSDRDFNDVVLTVRPGGQVAKGTRLQGLQERELIDLRGLTGDQPGSFVVNSEALFNNTVGLYTVDNPEGAIGTLRPGDVGYAQAAIARRVTNLSRSANTTGTLAGGGILAPFLIANGTVDQFLARNASNAAAPNASGSLPVAYFSYIAANPDGVDHVRLLGDNTFGFEDLPNGGDRDFNDIVFQVRLS
jgi:3-phytase/alkaline phosphatase D